MTRRRTAAIPAALISAVALFVLFVSAQSPARQESVVPPVSDSLREQALRSGRVRVIVELNLPTGPHIPEGSLPNAAAIAAQRRAIETVGNQLRAKLPPAGYRLARHYQTIPFVALEVNAAALAALEESGSIILRVIDDAIVRMVLAESVPLVEGDQVWDAGYDGTGTTIAVLDTGVDANHPFLSGKVVEEACYSSTVAGVSQSVCPNGLDEQIGAGAAAPCLRADCLHGTHVAGIAAGSGAQAGEPFSGVARNAQLMAVQVFSEIIDADSCGGAAPCLGAYTSDVIAGLERIYAVAAPRQVAAVNVSLSGALFSVPCNSEPYKPAIDNLRSIGVATIAASGNNGSTRSISTPACVSSAVSVGSVSKSDTISWFSNVSPFLSLLAPGESIRSSVPGTGFVAQSGTSMAAPHVAGAWALLRQAAPGETVSTILRSLEETGDPIADNRFFGTSTVPRMNVFQALASLVAVANPSPTVTSVSPTSLRAGSGPVTLTVTGSGFNAFSAVLWNGTAKSTEIISTSMVQASIPAADLAEVGSAQVSVSTPPPGGGTSATLTVTIDPPPALVPNATTVGPGSAVTVTLTNGVGGSKDWLALAATGSPDTSYLKYTYVGAGVTERTWTVTLPSTSGGYEFRLFLDGGYTRAATSSTVTVDPSYNPLPGVTSLVPARTTAGGSAFTLTVNGSGFVSQSVVQWNGSNRPTTFVSSTQVKAAIDAADVANVGSTQVSVFSPPPGGGTSTSLTFTISPPPSLSVNATSVVGGDSATVTLANGPGGAADWLALAATTAANTSYLQWVYVGAGVTARSWTVTMPLTAGTYEFRLFLNGGYTRAATSPPVTVSPGPNPVPTLTSISPGSTPVGGPGFTLTVNGAGFVSASVVRWNGVDRTTTFVSSTQLKASIPSTDLSALGTAQVTAFSPAPGGGLSTALPFNITPPPSLSVSATTAQAGASITVTLTNGFGGSLDWLAFAASGAANTSYLQYVYVGAGVTTRTWTVTLPATGGMYEFRLFLNNGYTRAATSPTVTVLPGPNPVPSLSSISPVSTPVGSAGVTLTANGSGFVASSVVRWNGADRTTTFVSGTQLRAVIPSSDLTAMGTAQVTVFSPAPEGGLSSPQLFTISSPPSLSISVAEVLPGGSVTVTLTNGYGGASDWLALAPSAAANTSYLQWIYVGSGVTTRTWTVAMPATAGTYEFRLFLNNGYTRAATSPTVTVVAPPEDPS